MVEHSGVHLGFEPPHLQRQPCLKVLQRLPIPSIRGTSRELSCGSLAHDTEHSSVEVVMWVSRPKIGGGAVPRRFICESDAADGEPGWRDFVSSMDKVAGLASPSHLAGSSHVI